MINTEDKGLLFYCSFRRKRTPNMSRNKRIDKASKDPDFIQGNSMKFGSKKFQLNSWFQIFGDHKLRPQLNSVDMKSKGALSTFSTLDLYLVGFYGLKILHIQATLLP